MNKRQLLDLGEWNVVAVVTLKQNPKPMKGPSGAKIRETGGKHAHIRRSPERRDWTLLNTLVIKRKESSATAYNSERNHSLC